MLGNFLDTETTSEADVDYSSLKVNLIGLFGALSALALSYAARQYFYEITSLTQLWFFAAAAAVFLVAVFLQCVFIKDFSWLGMVIFVEVSALASFFVFEVLRFVFAGCIAAFAFMLWTSWNTRRYLSNSIKISIMATGAIFYPKAVTALCIFLAAAYVSSFEFGGALLSRDLFVKILLPADPIVTYYYPGVSISDTFSDAARKIAEKNLAEDTRFDILGQEEKERVIADAVQNFKNNIMARYGSFELDENKKVVDIAYTVFTNYIRGVPQEKKFSVAALFGLAVFLILRSFGTPFYWIVNLIAVVWYETLVALGFAFVSSETRSKEIVLLK